MSPTRVVFVAVGAMLALSLAGPAAAQKRIVGPMPYNPQIVNCPVGPTELCVPLDASFSTVPFAGNAGCSGPANLLDPCRRNDDDSSVLLNLGFTFNMYGAAYTTCYINNNGNITFDNPYCTFTAAAFPIPGFPMVAPFWADVDTRNGVSGVVSYQLAAHHLIVTWDHVGYYQVHADKRSTFQVIISDGTDPLLGLGNNVCFCYDGMEWTTGDASGGVGGYGGVPATVGVNKGDGVNFFQLGRFDHAGVDYNGPGGIPSGVQYLNGQHICFNVAPTNIPPIPQGFPANNTVTICVGQTLVLNTAFTSPEIGQTTTTVVDLMGLLNATATSVPGNPSTQTLTFTPSAGQVGTNTVRYTATDDGAPPATTVLDLTIRVLPANCATPTRRETWGKVKSIYR